MAKVNKSQVYAVKWLLDQNNSIDQIVEELGLPIKQVQDIADGYVPNPRPEPPKGIEPKDLMIRHTSAKNSNSVSIMTKEASELNDSKRQNLTTSVPKDFDSKKGIFRPRSK